jgi:hypothetical protein
MILFIPVRAFATAAARRTTQKVSNTGAILSEKFNLASLNNGKNPFEVSSNRLLNGQNVTKHIKKNKATNIKDVYSLEFLLGQKKKKKMNVSNPFDVASAKLM